METSKHATMKVDGRTVLVTPCASSGSGRTDGVAVIASTPSQVRALVNCLPGRVLVLVGSAVTPLVVELVEAAISHGTFSGIVVHGRSPFSNRRLNVPVVEIAEGEHWTPVVRRNPLRLVVDVAEVLHLGTRSGERTAAGA